MNLLSFIGVSDAFAADAATAGAQGVGGLVQMLPMLLIFGAVFYFLFIRPQNKRANDHRTLLSELSKGDEVLTNGGIIGRIAKINEDFVMLSVADQVDITIKKDAIANVLPKGTLKTV